jgi:hypothetical protein
LARSIKIAIAAFAGIISTIYLFVPIARAEQDELSIRKYRITADFPCRPKRSKQVIGGAETGGEMPQTILVCAKDGITYLLSAIEYSEQRLKVLTADVWAKDTLDGVRSLPHYTLKSSSRLSYQNFPAIRMDILDTNEPPTERTRLLVLTDAGVVMMGISWPSGSPEPSPSTTFTNSLTIAPVKN